MKKVFYVSVEECDYDQYDAVVVLAENLQEAKRIVKEEDYFQEDQGKVTYEEVDLNGKSEVILDSFRAG